MYGKSTLQSFAEWLSVRVFGAATFFLKKLISSKLLSLVSRPQRSLEGPYSLIWTTRPVSCTRYTPHPIERLSGRETTRFMNWETTFFFSAARQKIRGPTTILKMIVSPFCWMGDPRKSGCKGKVSIFTFSQPSQSLIRGESLSP